MYKIILKLGGGLRLSVITLVMAYLGGGGGGGQSHFQRKFTPPPLPQKNPAYNIMSMYTYFACCRILTSTNQNHCTQKYHNIDVDGCDLQIDLRS